MKLHEMLEQFDLVDLLVLADGYHISFEGIMTKREVKALYSVGGKQILSHYYKLLKNGEELFDPEFADQMQGNKKFERFRKKEETVMTALRKADNAKSALAVRIALEMLVSYKAMKYLQETGPYMFEFLDILKQIPAENSRYAWDIPLDYNYSVKSLQGRGYAVSESTEPLQNEDGHLHYHAITVPDDVLELFEDEFMNLGRPNGSRLYVFRKY